MGLARCAAPGGDERVADTGGHAGVTPGHRERQPGSEVIADMRPALGRCGRGIDVHIELGGEGGDDLEMGGRQTGKTEQHDAAAQMLQAQMLANAHFQR